MHGLAPRASVWHLFMEEIAHRVDEELGRLLHLPGSVQSGRGYLEPEPVLIILQAEPLKPLRHRLGVAVPAPRRYLVTAHRRVPGRLSPLDLGFGHFFAFSITQP